MLAALVGIGMAVLGCAVTVGMVIAKVGTIDEIRKAISDLVRSNHVQDVALARITEHLGISPHTSRYESK